MKNKQMKGRLMHKMRYAYASVMIPLWTMAATVGVSAAGGGTNGTNTIDGFIRFACEWLQKIGMVIALVGGVMFALGWQREDAEGKSRGLMTIMAGLMLTAIGVAPSIFMNSITTPTF